MNIIKGSLDNPVARFMVTLGVMVLGVISFTNLAIDLFPEITYPVAGVITEYRGATPEDVETGVTRPVEKSVSRIQGVKHVASYSREGISLVTVQFVWGTNLDAAAIDIQQNVSGASNQIAEGSDRPIIIKNDPSQIPVVTLGFQGSMDDRKLREIAEDYIAPRIEALPGVAVADVFGGNVREIQIDVDRGRLEGAGLSLQDVVEAVSRGNVDVPGGSVKTGTRDINVRTLGRPRVVESLGDMVIRHQRGTPIRIRDIGQVKDRFEDPISISLLNGGPGLFISIRKAPGGNTVKVADQIFRELQKLQRDLPQDVNLFVVSDQSTYIRRSIQNLKHEAYIGALLAAVVVFLFLGNLRSTLIISLSIPISIVTTFVLLYFGGMTLNIMTLGGLALGVGRLVDDSIVVLENIYRRLESGEEPYQAAYRGTLEVTRPIIAATLTSVIVFLPIAFIHGVASILFSQMAFTVAFSLLASLFESLTMVPILCHWFLRPRQEPYRVRALQAPLTLFGRFFSRMEERYGALLAWALNHKARILLGTLGVFALSSMLLFRIDTELFPPSDEGEFGINVRLPVGTRVEETLKVVEEIQQIVIEDVPELMSVFGRAGAGRGRASIFAGRFAGPHSGNVRVRLVPHAERRRSSFEIMQALRPKLGRFPGARLTMSPGGLVTRVISFGAEDSIAIEIQGYDLKRGSEKAAEIAQLLREVPGVADIQVSREEGMPEYKVELDHQRIAALGLNPSQVAGAVRSAVDGTAASNYIDPSTGKEHKIRVRLREEDRKEIRQLNRIFIKADGHAIPLNNLAKLTPGTSPTQVERKYQQRMIHVTANVTGRGLGSAAREIEALLREVETPKDFNIRLTGAREEQEQAFRNLTLALLLAVALVYMVLAAQYGSLLHPFVIMFSVPLGLIGVVWILYATETTLSIISFIGVIMMVGIVVSNAILLVEYTNQLRARGTGLYEAVTLAGKTRLRPIMMTSFTTILGLLPLALGLGEGAEVNAPLALSVIGGLTVSTFMTLVFVPTLYAAFEQIKSRRQASAAGAE
jgi:CzcA family heavy metal efflux pump